MIEKSAKIIFQILAGVDVSFTVHFMVHKRRLLIAAASDVQQEIKFLEGMAHFQLKPFVLRQTTGMIHFFIIYLFHIHRHVLKDTLRNGV